MLYQFNQIGRVSPTFTDASIISQHIISSNVVFDHVEIYYNKFKSVIQHNMNIINIYNIKQIMESSQYGLYDSLDESVLLNYNEFLLSSIIYYVLAQGNCSEQSSRMTAMENASKNAREMIKDFELLFNRTRQRVITNELIEIISGASAIEDA
ncbi:hypothetical protein A3Q56_05728 [Intoshia linei]|uniref:ATP synthase subunit gamma, mitochondrial n=1 Tax=Intoshia linei TaxID=1819745 RepID=A0A177AWQ8_9BILA|nr:hypothetical protein A3Q56_05728 [Intoshia linei]